MRNIFNLVHKYYPFNSYYISFIEKEHNIIFMSHRYVGLPHFYCHALILKNRDLFIDELEFLEDLLFSRDHSNYLIAEQIILSKLEQNE